MSRRRSFVNEVEVKVVLYELRDTVNRQFGGKFTGNNNVDLEGNLQNSYVVWEQEQQQVIIAEKDEVGVLNRREFEKTGT